MIKPLLKDDEFLKVIHEAPDGRLYLWWLGQSGYLLKWNKSYALIDPYLSDSLTKKYAGTTRPHVRMTERVVDPCKLDFIDVTTSSHNHTDHLDGETLIPLFEVNPGLTLIVPKANIQFAANRLKISPERLTPISVDGDGVTKGPFTFHAVPSAHEYLETDENGEHKFVGYIIEVGGRTIYHSGDCVQYDGLAERLNHWRIDLALLPINGRDPDRGVPGNFTGSEAAELSHHIKAGLTIPCHYDMFEFNTVSADRFVGSAQRLGCPYRILKGGEGFYLSS